MNPLEINFSESYLRQLKEPLLAEQLDNYVKLDARFEDNRIDVKATLQSTMKIAWRVGLEWI